MPDNRTLTRFRKRLYLRFGSADVSRLAFTEDVSHDGLFIKSAHIISPGGQIHIVLDLPGGQVKLEGRVMWAKNVPGSFQQQATRAGMGVRIIRFQEGEEIFRTYCDSLIKS